MGIEIEKKYRLAIEQRQSTITALTAAGAEFAGEDFEENILYSGGILSLKSAVLRLRTTQTSAILTYKESLPSSGVVKRRTEHETVVSDAAAMREILASLEYKPALIYEKRRQKWHLDAVEIVVDELPFGYFLEIEGEEAAISAAEAKLGLTDLAVEPLSYPALTTRLGKREGNLTAARFV